MPQYLALGPDRSLWWRLADSYGASVIEDLIQTYWDKDSNDPLRFEILLGSDETPSKLLINPKNITAVAVVEEPDAPKRLIRF
jgi:hypothetical protein